MENIGKKKNTPGPTNFYSPNLGEKLRRKERKWGLSSWITNLPPPSWCLICGFFPFILFYFILFSNFIMGSCVQVILVLDSLSFLPIFIFIFPFFCFFFFFIFFKFLSFVFVLHPFFFQFFWVFFLFFGKKGFGFLNFLSSFYFIFFNEEIIHTYFFNKNIMYYFCFT